MNRKTSKRQRKARRAFALGLIVFVILGFLASQGHAQRRREMVIQPGQQFIFYELSPEVLQSLLIDQVPPVYPKYAKQKHIRGAVVLHVMTNCDGSVNNLAVASGARELWQAALDAVKHWRYRPYLVNGEPVRVSSRITVTFTLAKDDSGSSAR